MDFQLFRIAQEGSWIWVLFLLGVVGCYVLLAQRNSVALASAITRGICSVVVSPFQYLRKTISELSLGDANPRLLNVDHFILKRLLLVMQVGLLLGVFIGSGLAVTSAVVAFLPPRELRWEMAEERSSLVQDEAILQEDSATVKNQDSDWESRRPELIKEAQQQERQKTAAAQSAIRADKAALKSPVSRQVLDTLNDFFAVHRGEYGILEQARSFINRIPTLDESDAKVLLSYCDHWEQLQSLSSRAAKTNDQMRAEIQPDHGGLVQKISTVTQQADTLRENIKSLQERINLGYHPGQSALILIGFLLSLIPFVWVVGTSVELFSMAIFLSNDVKHIRSANES